MGICLCNNVEQKINVDKSEVNPIRDRDILLNKVKNYICQIYENNNLKGIGFFCYIPYPDDNNLLPSLITNNHLINENSKEINIKLLFDNNTKKIDLNDNRKIYKSIKYDTTIIEIKPNQDNIEYFFELDDNIDIENRNFNEVYSERSIYMIDYPNDISNTNKASVSLGTLKKISEINKFDIYHLCCSSNSLPGSPILFSSNNKVIGIQKEVSANFYDFNKGTFLKYPIIEFINQGKKINEILITLKINESDIDKNIYFLNNIEDIDNTILKEDDLYELNNENIEIFINNKKIKFRKFIKPKKIGIYQIKLKLNTSFKNCHKMFYNCGHIINIDLSFFDASKIVDMSHMFSRYNNLICINFNNFQTNKVNNMSYMFSHCSNLINIDLSSFNTSNVKNMSYMFYNCSSISNLNLSNFNTKNVTDMSYTFYNCKKLKNISLSNFNTKNVVDMSYMFSRCKKLKNIDLINFNTVNVSNMSHMFSYCNNLIDLNLAEFDTENAIDVSSMFAFCKNIVKIDMSKFDTKNMKYMNDMFLNCCSLISVKFPLLNIKNIRNMSYMFYNCFNLAIFNRDFLEYINVGSNNVLQNCINIPFNDNDNYYH